MKKFLEDNVHKIKDLTYTAKRYILSIYLDKEGIKVITKIQKWGNSQGVRIPKVILEDLNWKDNELLKIDVKDGRLVIEKNNEKRNIKEIFKDYNEEYEPEYVDWGEPKGDEIW